MPATSGVALDVLAEAVGEAASRRRRDAEPTDGQAPEAVTVAAGRVEVDARAVVRVVASLRRARERGDVHDARDSDQVVPEAPGPLHPDPHGACPRLVPAVRKGHVDAGVVLDGAVLVAGRPEEEDALAAAAADLSERRDPVAHHRRAYVGGDDPPRVGEDVHAARDVVEHGHELRVADEQAPPGRLPLDRQEPAAGRGSDGHEGVRLCGGHARARRPVIRAGLVHPRRVGVGVAAPYQPRALEVPPAGKLVRAVEVRVVELAAVVGDADDDLRQAAVAEDRPGLFAAGRRAGVDRRVDAAAVEVPLAHVGRVGRRERLVRRRAGVEVVVGALDEGLVLRQLHDQLDRVHPGMAGDLEEELARGVLLELDEAVAAGELGELLGGGRLLERHEDGSVIRNSSPVSATR
jgi:hypothetical protein